MAITLEKPHALLVEGQDEVNLLDRLLREEGIDDVQLIDARGSNNIRGMLGAVRNAPGASNLRALGVVRDADRAPRGAFQSVQDALRDAGLPCPGQPLEVAEGRPDRPNIVVFITPGEDRPGDLETLCLEAVRSDPAFACVETYFRCLREAGLEEPQSPSKAQVQAFLASRPRYVSSLGVAAQKCYWPIDGPAFKPLRILLDRLRS